MASGMACYQHPSVQAVAQCNKCGKGMCKDCYDAIGKVCSACLREMSDTTRDDVLALMERESKEVVIFGIFAGIGLILGVIVGIMNDNIFGFAWVGTGIGGSVGYLFAALKSAFRRQREAGNSITGSFKKLFIASLVFVVIGLFIGPILPIGLILARLMRKKKSVKIIASEEKAITAIENYFKSETQDNKTELPKNVNFIINNFKLCEDGVSIDIFKKLRTI